MTYIPDLWNARNDGSGSGLDADLLDGINSAAFLQDITGESLEDLNDVLFGAPAAAHYLRHNGTQWANAPRASLVSDINAEGGVDADLLEGNAASAFATSGHNHTLDGLSNTTITAIASGEILKWNGSAWINNTLAEAGIAALASANTFTAAQTINAAAPTLTFKDTADALDQVGPRWVTSTGTEKWTFQFDGSDLWIYNHNGAPTPSLKFDLALARVEFPLLRRPTAVGAGSPPQIVNAADYVVFSGDDADTLADINYTTEPANGQVLVWDSGNSWWEPANLSPILAVLAKTAAYTILTSDDVVTGDSTSGAFTLTLPTAVGNTGKAFHMKRINSGANVITIDGNAAETIDGATSVTLDVQWHAISIVSDGANWLIV